MSIWGEIKKAINSTIGTDDVRPLDELLLDGKGLFRNMKMATSALTSDKLSEFTLLSISNAKGGQINGVRFPCPKYVTGDKMDYVIRVDGVDVFRVRYEPTVSSTGSNFRNVIVTQLKNILMHDKYYTDKTTLMGTDKSYVNYRSVNDSPFKDNSNLGTTYTECFNIYKPIKFNNSVEVKIEAVSGVITKYGDSYGYVSYDLYD